jgi:hypothetical protein
MILKEKSHNKNNTLNLIDKIVRTKKPKKNKKIVRTK